MAETLSDTLNNHFIICGFGHVGYRIAELLHALCEPFVVVTRDIRPEWRETILGRAVRFIEGDARAEANLRAADIATARALFIVTDNDLINTEIALDAQKLNTGLPIIVRIFDLYLAERLDNLGAFRGVLSPAMLTAPVFVAAALGEDCLRAFDIGGSHLHVVRFTFTAQSPGVGKTVGEFCQTHDLLPLAFRAATDSAPAPVALPFAKRPLAVGDELYVIGSGPKVEQLLHHGFRLIDKGNPLIALRRNRRSQPPPTEYSLRSVRDLWRHMPPILRNALLALLVFIGISTVFIHYCMPGDLTWIDSVYFVITIMTTIGFGDYNFRDAPWWLKLYGMGMMISGALLVAVMFGIISDYIITLRVEQTLGRLPTRLKNHVVVVGLGDVGSRVVEMLRRHRVPVVAIERTPEHEAVPTLQDKIQVIIADANRESTMRQANIPQARAIVVTATSDLDGLRIAHLAETLNPDILSVIRIYDSALARKLGSSVGVEQMVNAAATAAPTFVGSALRPGVEQAFTLGRRLFLLRWLHHEESVTMQGKSVRELRLRGDAVLLKSYRQGEQQIVRFPAPDEVITADDMLLVLEEYDPDTRTCRLPQLAPIADESAL